MNTFTKKFNRWVVKMEAESAPGQTVTVTTRNGATKSVTLGAFLSHDRWGFYYDVRDRSAQATNHAPAIDAVEAEMHRLETEMDRLQTQRDELAKARARAAMEDTEQHTAQERAAHRMERE